MPIDYSNPVSTRLTETEQEIVKKIQAKHEKPGLVVNISAALKIALHFWAEHNKEDVGKPEKNLPEN